MTSPAPGSANAFTIASNNYLAFASVFVESYRRHHPAAEVCVAIADRRDPGIDYERLPFRTVFAEELGIPAFLSIAFHYDILELNTAIKPFVFSWLRDHAGWDRALYFDPDILILSPLRDVENALEHAQAVITPHLTAPIDDEHRPSERQIRMMGIYNLGFVGLRLDPSTESFLAWWQRRLERFCINDPHHGLFVDQSWMDFAPAFLERVEILRSPRLNVAYWNLGQREVELAGDSYRVAGEPLGFVHWSGLDLDRPEQLSRHQDRISLDERPVLRRLLGAYRDQILSAGHERFTRVPYGYDTFRPEAIPIAKFLRRTLLRVDPHGRRFADPFDIAADDSFFRWLSEPLRFPLGTLNRAALAVWESRPELVERFRDVVHDELPRFLDWLHSGGGAGAGLAPELLAGLEVFAAPDATPVPFQQEPFRPFLQLTHEATPNVLEVVKLGEPGAWAPWLLEPFPGAGERPWLSRLAILCWEKSPVLQRTFPAPLGGDLDALAVWLATRGEPELGLAPELVSALSSRLPIELRSRPPRSLSASPGDRAEMAAAASALSQTGAAVTSATGAVAPPRSGATRRAFGVQVLAARRSEPDSAELASATLAALAEAGIAHQEIDLDAEPLASIVESQLAPAGGSPWPVTLTHVDLRLAPWRFGWLAAGVSQGGCRIGYLDWEFATIPAHYQERLKQWDEIWTPSRFARDVLAAGAAVPVHWVPPYRPVADPTARVDPATAGSAVPARILASFRADDPIERDDPWMVIEAARRLVALRPERAWAVVLRIDALAAHSNPASPGAELVAALRDAASGLPVEIETSVRSARQRRGVHFTADLYLHLRRTGGYSGEIVDAALAGVPVVALAHGARADWLDDATGFPVASRPARLGRSLGPVPGSTLAVEADPDAAAAALAQALGDPAESARRAAAARKRVEALYGKPAAATRMLRELDRVRDRIAVRQQRSQAETRAGEN